MLTSVPPCYGHRPLISTKLVIMGQLVSVLLHLQRCWPSLSSKLNSVFLLSLTLRGAQLEMLHTMRSVLDCWTTKKTNSHKKQRNVILLTRLSSAGTRHDILPQKNTSDTAIHIQHPWNSLACQNTSLEQGHENPIGKSLGIHAPGNPQRTYNSESS